MTARNEESSSAESDDDAEILINSSVAGEVGKGKAVTHQLRTWDKLLELRIQQQKMLAKVNRLPVDGYWEKLIAASPNDLNDVMKETQSALKALLNSIQYLEAILVHDTHNLFPCGEEDARRVHPGAEETACPTTTHQWT